LTDLLDQLQRSLGSNYTVEREMESGGMSRVVLARDESLGRDVVVKVFSPELTYWVSAERFTREIKLAAALQEPHIVPVLSAGQTEDGLPFYTMPFVRGESLRARILKGRIPIEESLSILRDVAFALAYAHRQGIVHRDIKPENILLSEGTAVVTDFGIAKALQAARAAPRKGMLTATGASLGTPMYMAPEQAAADPTISEQTSTRGVPSLTK
jgi:serine/threonine protein kinase